MHNGDVDLEPGSSATHDPPADRPGGASDGAAAARDVLAAFAAWGPAAYATACHLAVGDRADADNMLVTTFQILRWSSLPDGDDTRSDSATRATLGDVDEIRALVHRVFLADRLPLSNRVNQHPLGQLDVGERVALSLHDVEHRSLVDTAELIGMSPELTRTTLDAARRVLADLAPDTPLDTLVCETELWLDDASRERVRIAITAPLTASSMPTGAFRNDELGRSSDRTGFGRHRRSAVQRSHRSPSGLTLGIVAGLVATFAIGFAWVSSAAHHARSALGGTVALQLPAATETHPGASTADSVGSVIDDLPTDFQSGRALDNDMTTSTSFATGGSGWFELWASTRATHTSGTWLAAGYDQQQTEFGISPTAQRTTVKGLPALFDDLGSGIARITALLPLSTRPDPTVGGQASQAELVLTGRGLSQSQLVTLAAAVTLPNGIPDFSGTTAAPLLAGLDQIVSRPTAFFNSRRSNYEADGFITYYPPAKIGVGGRLTVSVAPSTSHDLDIARLLLASPEGVDSSHRTVTVDASGAPLSITWSADPDGGTLLQWHDRDSTMTLSGDLQFEALLRAAASTRRATATEWSDLLRRALQPPEAPVDPDPTAAPVVAAPLPFTDVATVTTAVGDRWTLSLSPDAATLKTHVDVAGSGRIRSWEDEEPAFVDGSAHLVRYSAMNATVIVVAYRDPGQGVAVRFDVSGRGSTTIPFVPIDDTTGPQPATDVAAAYAFSENASFNAALVDASGAVVEQLVPGPG